MDAKQISAIFLILATVVTASTFDFYKIIETKSGRIRGKLDSTIIQNKSFYSFRGIPYAKKPIGALRFKAPEPVGPWQNVLDAFDYQNSCYQQSWALGNSGGENEDCLYLNVFVPAEHKQNEKFAVMFFIHGGGFAEGSGNNYYNGPDFLLERNVIVVTINYRLGAFGFLSLGSAEHSGNMGLKDQQLALQWIHENVDSFNGDCDRITVFGQSAGAVSTHYQVLSDVSRKFIKRAICISGSAFLFYSYLDVDNHLDKMYAFAHQLNVSVNTFDELKEFLHSVDAAKIVEFTSQKSFGRTLTFDWAPVIENRNAIRPFQMEPPQDIYRRRQNIDVEMIFGYTDYECAPLIWNDVTNISRLNEFLNNFKLTLPIHNFKSTDDYQFYRQKLNKIYDHYFANANTERDRIVQYVNLISDMNMVYPIDKAAKVHSNQTKTFYYEFEVSAALNVNKQNQLIDMPGASHGDDLCYLFRCHMIDSRYYKILKERDENEITLQTIKFVTELYTNFAKYGHPTVDDEPVSGYEPIENHKIHYVRITNDGLFMDLSPKNESTAFWEHITTTDKQTINTEL